ncbi:MAG: trimeric autotransporter adhesin, partial [Microbacteriaceae bacterium]|nr:trimeric autotransporter adhesin [Microbacteriaceae bacterium]
STAAVTAATAAPAATVFVENGSTWSYYHQVTAPASDWLAPSFDSSAWPTGKGALGWGTGPIVTQIPAPSSPRPLATYFRASFTVPAGGIPAAGLTLTTRADDGVIVFVNGTEVGRANLPSGPITSSTYALSAPSTTTAVANPVQFTVPASLLQEGTNVIAAEVQSNYKSTPSVSFDLRAVAN